MGGGNEVLEGIRKWVMTGGKCPGGAADVVDPAACLRITSWWPLVCWCSGLLWGLLALGSCL